MGVVVPIPTLPVLSIVKAGDVKLESVPAPWPIAKLLVL